MLILIKLLFIQEKTKLHTVLFSKTAPHLIPRLYVLTSQHQTVWNIGSFLPKGTSA